MNRMDSRVSKKHYERLSRDARSLPVTNATHDSIMSRRQLLQQAGGGAGSLALAALMAGESHAARPFHAPQNTHFKPRAKRVIWLFMHGGPSHVDLFDPKKALDEYAGKPVPDSFGAVMTRRDVARNPLMPAVKPYKKFGESGLPVSTMLPEIGSCADDLCVIRSMHGNSVNHPQSVYQMNTGSILTGRPSFGSWLAYGLGTENQNMPAFVVLPDPRGGIKGGPPAWGSGFLPAAYQGITIRPGEHPILDLKPQPGVKAGEQLKTLKLIQDFNHIYARQQPHDDELEARIASYELAFRMQTEAPELVDISEETDATHKMYGLHQPHTSDFGRRCLLARRMIERGVRFVQVYSGDTGGWDAHRHVINNHGQNCGETDLPVAGLLRDLKQRGLLEDTLVIWGGEFGRMPMSEQGNGRDHNPWGFCSWLAGAGVQGGRAIGATDDIGLRAAVDKVPVKNFHATILHLMGMDHNKLTYYHNGLEKRLTGPSDAEIVEEVING